LRSFHATPASSSQTPSQASNSKFKYGIAASFSAKDAKFNPAQHVRPFTPAPISSRPDSGQDAYFVSHIGDSNCIALGVADGVGGWADSGVDPAEFSHGFCEYMASTASSFPSTSPKPLSAKTLMQKGYDALLSADTVKAGGSTACVGIASSHGTLDVANLGDSGFLQLRLNAVHYVTEPQTHAFNTPYQLAIIPENMRQRISAFGGTQLSDMPKDSSVTSHDLRHGDILVFATDGVWDNLSPSDILRIVSSLMLGSQAWSHSDSGITVGSNLSEFIKEGSLPTGQENLSSLQSFLAMGITAEAKAASVNTKVDGPFAREVQRHYPEEMWRGGKVDDICAVVAVVAEEGR
jgi:protein phosphatase PTC7